jgi:hypothetical protein
MRYILILCFSLLLFADKSYDFDEYKFVLAAAVTFKQSGNISFDKNKTTITYFKPKYKQIVNNGVDVTIEGSSGKIYKLKGKALFYTKLFIESMSKMGDFDKLNTTRNFDIKKKDKLYIVGFKGDMKDQLIKAEVKVKKSKVESFKLFMINGDTLEIVKK